MNNVIIIQARMSSTRLPGKVLKTIAGKPLLWYVRKRCEQSSKANRIIIATTTEKEDDAIEEYCQTNTWDYSRGDLQNVLKRYYNAAKIARADAVIRVTGDCPLIDGKLIDEAITIFAKSSMDYVSNTITRTYPRGFDIEVFSFDALETTYRRATQIEDQEHVTPFIWKNKTGTFKIAQLTTQEDYSHYRITVDTPEDFEAVRVLIEDYHADDLGYNDIIEILKSHPEISTINSHIEQKKV